MCTLGIVVRKRAPTHNVHHQGACTRTAVQHQVTALTPPSKSYDIHSRAVHLRGLGAGGGIALVANTMVVVVVVGFARMSLQCREKWRNDLRPDISKEPWTLQEEYVLAR